MNLKSLFFEKFRWDILVGIFLAVAIIYLFLRSTLHEVKIDSETNAAIAEYTTSPTQSNFERLRMVLIECMKIDDWDCKRQFNSSKVISTLVAYRNIDSFIQANVYDEERTFQLASEWDQYVGKSPIGLLRRAEAQARASNYSGALSAFRLSFDAGKKNEVARDLIHIYRYFGCKDDISIWSEYFHPTYDHNGPYLNPTGASYPEQPSQLTVEEIIDRRTRLRRGEFQMPTATCPVTKLINF
ncbi:hypothetical protein GCM10011613_25610 [Cellvibrio zantedeschiae]|uniref:Uncharacterized protein n=1 Tax=Cellvibrio zantedeschiae TaxID=1237077 RepID=A0ABQ3B9C2_9GAMM|nr:hypothetical protein [Cellvibrio zantedeschiae]GGY79609.1 hypothetical protein GCM10011613_25610 [Cellvibrio zantedeschiae]